MTGNNINFNKVLLRHEYMQRYHYDKNNLNRHKMCWT